MFSKDLMDSDTEDRERKTGEILDMIANNINENIQFTWDTPGQNTNNRMPVLDLACWVTETNEGTLLNYEFYMKHMANSICLPSNSAICTHTKFNTYRQEAFRVLTNTAVHLPWSVKVGHLTRLSRRMQLSGYTEGFRVKVINGGLRN